jgi:hypothetical protein
LHDVGLTTQTTATAFIVAEPTTMAALEPGGELARRYVLHMHATLKINGAEPGAPERGTGE